MRQTRPYFLSVDNEVVTVENSARLQAREIGTRGGLGITLTPDLFAGEHRREMTFFLLFAAEMHDGRADTIDRKLISAVQRQSEAQHFILIDRLIDHVGAATAPFLWPVQRDVAGLVEASMVIEELIPALIVANIEEARSRPTEAFAAAPECLSR